MESVIHDLEDGGWVRVGPYSPYWKAPDDTGPTGRKWSERSAHAEMIARRSVRKVSKAKSSTSSTGTKRGPGRPRKPPAPESDD